MKQPSLELAGNELRVGDRVRLFGGYSQQPEWLNGKAAHYGSCIAFIPGQNEKPAAVIEIDESASFENMSGKFLVLELRYAGAEWRQTETVHAELFSVVPECKPYTDRKQGLWVESHASYQVI